MRKPKKSLGAGRACSPRGGDSSGGAATLSVSALIKEANIWSDWLPSSRIGPLSWVQMAGMLMRATKPERIIDTLAPTLVRTRSTTEAKCRRLAKGASDKPVFLMTYEGYREQFQDELLEHFAKFLESIDGNTDLEWLRDRLNKSGAGAQSFVWFLLNGIATAQLNDSLDENKVKREARWLANIDFYEPAMMSGDEVVLQEFYEAFRETFPRAAPLLARPLPSRSLESPIYDSEDPYIERLAAIEQCQKRQANLVNSAASTPIDLPEDAWCRAMRSNPWERALDLARVPMFHRQRQLAFLLRDVSLDEVVLRAERALLEMADTTARNAIDEATADGKKVGDVRFGLWFKWWREHFRHWNDPVRTEIEQLCRSEDAGFVSDWLPRFESAVFANFLIVCARAYALENRLGVGPKNERILVSELFDLDTDKPLVVSDLYTITVKLWGRFCSEHGISDNCGHLVLDFEVDENALLSSEQPHAVIRV